MPTMKFFISKCFQFDDPKVSIATYVLLRFSAVKLQKNAKTADFNAFLICSKQRWIICEFVNLTIVNNFNKTQYDLNQKTRTTVIHQ